MKNVELTTIVDADLEVGNRRAREFEARNGRRVEDVQANRAFYDFKFADDKMKAGIAAFTNYTVPALWMALKDFGMPDESAKEEAERISAE